MNYGECVGCGKSLAYKSAPICTNCDTRYRTLVKEALLKDSNRSCEEVAKLTGVPEQAVKYYAKVGEIKIIDREMAERKRKMQLIALKGIMEYEKRANSESKFKGGYRYLTPETQREWNKRIAR